MGNFGADTYVFNTGDGTDRVADSGGRIIFEQGTNNNDYAGATYAFSNGDLKLTVTKGSETLNIIDFSEIPYDYTFTTRSGGSDTEIPDASLVLPVRPGSASNPYLATAAADSFTGGTGIYDWVSYAGSNAGVDIQFFFFRDATVSGGWAAGDSLDYNIDNLIGSDYADTLTGDSSRNSFEGGRGNDVLAGGTGIDTYVFNKGDGTDTITDSGGKIVFEQGTNNDYAGATYAFTYVDSNLRLTVTKSGNTLNTIDFTNYPSAYTFYTRSGGTDTIIPTSTLVIPTRPGGESNPFLATAAADRFSGTGIYDWVSYADSNAGVTINLNNNPATVSRGWAAGDTLTNIDNLIGSRHADTLSGDSGANTLRGGAGNDILEGRGDRDILEGGTGQDDYILDTSDDTIRSDSDGGRLLFRADSGNSAYGVARNSNGDVIVTVGAADITIDDSGADDAYQHGSYSIHYGTSDTFFRNLYAGREVADTIVGSSGDDYISGLGGNNKLYGGNGNDQIISGEGNDLLDGGRGDNLLEGGLGDDTYRFDAGTGTTADTREGGLFTTMTSQETTR